MRGRLNLIVAQPSRNSWKSPALAALMRIKERAELI
jgi:hypothetical protein